MSRKRARLAIVLLWVGVPLLLVATVVRVVWLILAAMVILLVAVAVPNHLCPYCGKFLEARRFDLGIHWSKPDEGYCRECGSLLKYDDQPQ